MGGRGASSHYGIYAARDGNGNYILDENGKTVYREYGDEFESVGVLNTSRGEIKVLRSLLTNNNQRIIETRTPCRVYATETSDGVLKTLYFYDSSGKLKEEWNSRHTHKGSSQWHKHIGYDHRTARLDELTENEKAYFLEIIDRWNKR